MPLPVDPHGPCPHPPGSKGKIRRLAYRRMYGFDLIHADDAGHPEVQPDNVDELLDCSGQGIGRAAKVRPTRTGRRGKRLAR